MVWGTSLAGVLVRVAVATSSCWLRLPTTVRVSSSAWALAQRDSKATPSRARGGLGLCICV